MTRDGVMIWTNPNVVVASFIVGTATSLNTHINSVVTETTYKIISPVKSLLNEQYAFVGGNIYFLCVLSCSSEEA